MAASSKKPVPPSGRVVKVSEKFWASFFWFGPTHFQPSFRMHFSKEKADQYIALLTTGGWRSRAKAKPKPEPVADDGEEDFDAYED